MISAIPDNVTKDDYFFPARFWPGNCSNQHVTLLLADTN